MLSEREVISTLNMLRNEHLDVRTVTLGVSLFDCVSHDLDLFTANVRAKLRRYASQLVAVCDEVGDKYGIPVVNKRISVSPIAVVGAPFGPDGMVSICRALDEASKEAGVDFLGGFTALVEKGFAKGDRALIEALPDALARVLKALGRGHLVHFSTDFVFSGPHQTPWREDDAPHPAGVYGRTKLAGEEAVLRVLPERSCVVRTAWLFGPGRKNFVDTILAACQKRDAISVVHDQFGSPTYSLDLAQWSASLAEKEATGIWHAVNSGQASWCELACEAIALTAGPCRLEPIASSQWPQKAQRPVYSVLDTSKLSEFLGKKPRPWPQALRDFLFSEYVPTPTKRARIEPQTSFRRLRRMEAATGRPGGSGYTGLPDVGSLGHAAFSPPAKSAATVRDHQ